METGDGKSQRSQRQKPPKSKQMGILSMSGLLDISLYFLLW